MRQKLLLLLLHQPVTSALRLQHIDVVLVGPQYASNVGQALRLCACFEVGRLKLVAPEYDRDADATYERRRDAAGPPRCGTSGPLYVKRWTRRWRTSSSPWRFPEEDGRTRPSRRPRRARGAR